MFVSYHLPFSVIVGAENLPLVMSQGAMTLLLQVSERAFQSFCSSYFMLFFSIFLHLQAWWLNQ